MKATQLENVRDKHQSNINRWNAAAACRRDKAGRILLLTEPACTTFLGGAYCNFSNCCLQRVELRFSVQKNGGPLPPDSLQVKTSKITWAASDADVDVFPSVYGTPTGTIFSYVFDAVAAQTSAVARLRFCSHCKAGDLLTASLSVHIASGTDATSQAPCQLPQLVTPSTQLSDLWTEAGLSTADAYFLTSAEAALSTSPLRYDCGCLPLPGSDSASMSASESISISLF